MAVSPALMALAGHRGTAVEILLPPDVIEKIASAVPAKARVKPVRKRTLLVFTLTRGFRHSSIPHAAKALELMGKATGAYRVVVSDDPAMFEPKRLKRFDAVLLANTTGELFLPPDLDKLPPAQREAARKRNTALKESLLSFVRGGKGLAGIHSATDCFYAWPEFGEMIGGYFNGHPWHQPVGIVLDDPDHPLCTVFEGEDFELNDEIYQFKEPYSRESLRILLRLDRKKTPERGNRSDNDYAVSWVRSYGKGRVFYCSLGHREEIFWNPLILRFYLDGIQFALGDLPADTTPSGALND